MSIVKNRTTPEGEEFWNHVEKVANEVRAGADLGTQLDATRETLCALVIQIERSNAFDDHGHLLRMLKALHDAQRLLGRPVTDKLPCGGCGRCLDCLRLERGGDANFTDGKRTETAG